MQKLLVAALVVAVAIFLIVGTVVCFGTRDGGRCSLAVGVRQLSIDFAGGVVEYADFGGATFHTPYAQVGGPNRRNVFGGLHRFTFLECAGWAGLAMGIMYVLLAVCMPRAKPERPRREPE